MHTSYWDTAIPVRRRRTLTPEAIARTTASLLDESGMENFSLRALAVSLGVAPASLYSRIRGTPDAFDLALDHTLGQDPVVPRRIETGTALPMLLALYHHLIQHPWAIQIIAVRPPRGPAYLAYSEALVRGLEEAGQAEPLAVAYAATNLVIGSALTSQAAHREPNIPVDRARARLYGALHAEPLPDPEEVLTAGLASILRTQDGGHAGPA